MRHILRVDNEGMLSADFFGLCRDEGGDITRPKKEAHEFTNSDGTDFHAWLQRAHRGNWNSSLHTELGTLIKKNLSKSTMEDNLDFSGL